MRPDALKAPLDRLPPPAIVFCKSHSGSRYLVSLLQAAGLFMGTHLNDSGDTLDLVPLVRYLVIRHDPDFAAALAGQDPMLQDMMLAAFAGHLAGLDRQSARRWGWKLCETTFALPVFARLFPRGRFIHLLRDGRDVAFSDHTGPTDDFWRKVILGRADIRRWRGLALDGPSYRRRPHLFNAQHWLASVGRGHDFMGSHGSSCLEIRYEDLCLDFPATAKRVLAFLELAPGIELPRPDPALALESIGKFRSQPWRKRREALEIIRPLQAALGYPVEDR